MWKTPEAVGVWEEEMWMAWEKEEVWAVQVAVSSVRAWDWGYCGVILVKLCVRAVEQEEQGRIGCVG